MYAMANGSMSVSVENSRKFMLKIVGFRDRFTTDDLIAKFRRIISGHVKDCISKIMIDGKPLLPKKPAREHFMGTGAFER